MFESNESLLPALRPDAKELPPDARLKVICLVEEEESADELDRLLNTLGVDPVARVFAQTRKLHPATYFGMGKLEQVAQAVQVTGAHAVIADVELSPNQLRNIEKAVGKPVLDRPGVILEIFSQHARSKEAKTQVALARLQYLLPRLAHFWSHFERQRGGGTASRGMGETQIEVDRRLVKQRIQVLKGRLAQIERERKIQRASRADVLKVALVGYTNAGKSTLLNALTQSEVRAEDKLFATLDTSVRALDPFGHPPVVAMDTVGFISNLPHGLVASFRSTLEEIRDADLIVHVVDASSKNALEQHRVTEEVLSDLEVSDKPKLVLLNKADRLKTPADRNRAKLIAPGALLLSSFDRAEVLKARESILNHFRKKLPLWEVLVPYEASKIEAQIHRYGSIEVKRHHEKGTFYRVRMEDGWAKKIGLPKFAL